MRDGACFSRESDGLVCFVRVRVVVMDLHLVVVMVTINAGRQGKDLLILRQPVNTTALLRAIRCELGWYGVEPMLGPRREGGNRCNAAKPVVM